MNKLMLALVLTTIFSVSNAEGPDGVDSIEGTATIVFMRSSMIAAAIKTSIYEVTNGETIFICILTNKKKINHQASVGKHTFMVVSEAAYFMEADVIAGKTYYSMITPRPGAWKARFSMIPVRNDGTTEFNTDSAKFEKWKKKTKVALMTDKSKAWYEKHKQSVEEKRTKYWAKWMQKSAEELAARTLNATDGM